MTGSTGLQAVRVDTVGSLVRQAAECIRQRGAIAPTADTRCSVRAVLAAVRLQLADLGLLYPQRRKLKELEEELAALTAMK